MENIDIYFEAINEVYKKIIEWEDEKQKKSEPVKQKISSGFLIFSSILMGFSIIPLLPSLFVFFGSRFSWQLFGYSFINSNFWTYLIVWPIFIIITVLIFILFFSINNAVEESVQQKYSKPPQSLSSEQLTFIFVYQAYKDLHVFFISHIDEQIEKTLKSLKKIDPKTRLNIRELEYIRTTSPEELEFFEGESINSRYHFPSHPYKNELSLSRQLLIAQEFLNTFEKYSWFSMDTLTRSRLQALISFRKRIIIRLQKRADLPAVLRILENLSKFLYAFLPEHKTNKKDEELSSLESMGIACFDKFVKEIDMLSDYPTERQTDKSNSKSKGLPFSIKLQTFYMNHIFFRMFVWLLILILVSSGLVYVAYLLIPKFDINLMVSTVIVASITGAAALAVIGGNPQNEFSKLKKMGSQHFQHIESSEAQQIEEFEEDCDSSSKE